MSSTKVSALTEKTTPSGSEELLINDGGVSKKVTISNLPDTDTTYTSSDFTHDDLTGFVANEHLDWSADQGATNIHSGNYTDTDTTYTASGLVSIDGSNVITTSANNYVHPNHSGDVVSAADGAMTIQVDAVDIAMLSATGTASSSTFLRGDNAWTAVDALPSQSGHAGKYLTTDASSASWATLDTDANTTTKGLYEHAHTISSNYSITSGNNALTAGPITINTGVSVTVPTGSTWIIA